MDKLSAEAFTILIENSKIITKKEHYDYDYSYGIELDGRYFNNPISLLHYYLGKIS